MTSPLVVYDTMVFLQAAIHPERQYATLAAVEDGRLRLCMSPEVFDEVREVLNRPALRAKFSALTPERVSRFLEAIHSLATHFNQVPATFSWLEHPDDNHIFNLAIRAGADHLVTWENRILSLPSETGRSATLLRALAPRLQIVTPVQLGELLRAATPPKPSS